MSALFVARLGPAAQPSQAGIDGRDIGVDLPQQDDETVIRPVPDSGGDCFTMQLEVLQGAEIAQLDISADDLFNG